MSNKPILLISVSEASLEMNFSTSYIRKYIQKGLIRYTNLQSTTPKGKGRVFRTFIYKDDLNDIALRDPLSLGTWLTAREIGHRLNVSRYWVYRLAHRGKIRQMENKKVFLFLLEDCRQFLSSNP